MHECPDCGMACACDGDDVWMDYAAWDCRHNCEFDDDYDEERDGFEACCDCGSPNISDMCQCCGGWLCYMHSETGAGFCKSCPTREWINEQQSTLA